MKLALVGATGLVGREMCKVLESRNFSIDEFIPVASPASVGKEIMYCGKAYKVVSMQDAIDASPDIALFSAGGTTSEKWAPEFAKVGTRVIDNSSAWRMDGNVPLVVPEVNPDAISESDMIIANPNCSTIQLVVVLQPLHLRYIIKRVVVSTYQSVTGTGYKAVDQMMAERKGEVADQVYPHAIDLNCLPHCDVFTDNDYTKEEMKMLNESRKIMGIPDLALTATAVRVPVKGGHSESVNITFEKDFIISELKELLEESQGIKVMDNPSINSYPTPLQAEGNDDVFIGRIRRDGSMAKSLNCWIVSDNLRKGAATNAVQIAELLVQRGITS